MEEPGRQFLQIHLQMSPNLPEDCPKRAKRDCFVGGNSHVVFAAFEGTEAQVAAGLPRDFVSQSRQCLRQIRADKSRGSLIRQSALRERNGAG